MNTSAPRILFLVKRREDYSAVRDSQIGLSTGLYNSAEFIRSMLYWAHIDTKLSVVIDNNDIHMEVVRYQPSHVIVEALWVVPSKFTELQRLHPSVIWIVRLHSEVPFLANEGIAMDWIAECSGIENVRIACNSTRMTREMCEFLRVRNRWSKSVAENRVLHLPNYYPVAPTKKKMNRAKPTVDVGCFGAIRPMKNHLIQALAAVEFADRIGKKLIFHINVGRIETNGNTVLLNLRSLFEQLSGSGHQMIAHDWTPHDEFVRLCASMDIGMQVSLSETFNIVSADLINNGVPLVSSHELPWAVHHFCANPTDAIDICDKLLAAYRWPRVNTWLNHHGLRKYARDARRLWLKQFRG